MSAPHSQAFEVYQGPTPQINSTHRDEPVMRHDRELNTRGQQQQRAMTTAQQQQHDSKLALEALAGINLALVADQENTDAQPCGKKVDPRKAQLGMWQVKRNEERTVQRTQQQPPFVVAHPQTHNAAIKGARRQASSKPTASSRSVVQRTIGSSSAAPGSLAMPTLPPTVMASPEQEPPAEEPRQNLQDVFPKQTSFKASMVADLMASMTFAPEEAPRGNSTSPNGTTIMPVLSSTDKAELQGKQAPIAPPQAPQFVAAPQAIAAAAIVSAIFNATQQQQQQQVPDSVDAFRAAHTELTSRLETMGSKWRDILTSAAAQSLSEEAKGEINAVLGQASLLINKRASQFLRLCDVAENPSAERTAKIDDLHGFWDVVTMQADDVQERFTALELMQKGGWATVADQSMEPPAPKKKRVRISKPSSKGRRGNKAACTPRRAAARDRLRQFKRSANQSSAATLSADASEGTTSSSAGISTSMMSMDILLTSAPAAPAAPAVAAAAVAALPVLTPVRATKKDREMHGSDFILTPVRRSTRNTPSRFRSTNEADMSKLLAQSGYAYKPNHALVEPAKSNTAMREDALDGVEEEEEADECIATVEESTPQPADDDMLEKYLFAEDSSPAPLTPTAAASAAAGGGGGVARPLTEQLVSFSPCPMPQQHQLQQQQQAIDAAASLGSIITTTTPSSNKPMLSDSGLTPLRRSARLTKKTQSRIDLMN